MSKRSSHARRLRRAGRRSVAHRLDPTLDPDEVYCVVAGWCPTLDDVADLRVEEHDAMIADLGDRRRGPVSWLWWTGPKAVESLEVLWTDPPSREHGDYYRTLRDLLDTEGGYLVVAMCAADPPDGVTVR